MAEPVTTEVATAGAEDALRPETALSLLRRRDFRRAYGAVAISELGDAFQYIALMWFALVAAGPLGVIAVRLADSVPAIVFGLHGGVVADRWDRRRVLVAADLVRWFQLLCLTGHLARAEPKTLRWRLWHAPARLVRHARRDIVRVLDSWPDADALIAAHTRIAALC